MIRIIRSAAGEGGKYLWTAAGTGVSGLSHQPLLDACRELKRMGYDPRRRIGMFRLGRDDFDLATTIGAGAELRIVEDRGGPRFRKFEDSAAIHARFSEAAE